MKTSIWTLVLVAINCVIVIFVTLYQREVYQEVKLNREQQEEEIHRLRKENSKLERHLDSVTQPGRLLRRQ